MSEHTVVMHRTPRPRIDLNPVRKRTAVVDPLNISAGSLALRELAARIENERIWGLVRQSAEGCNAATGTVE